MGLRRVTRAIAAANALQNMVKVPLGEQGKRDVPPGRSAPVRLLG